MRYVVNEHFSDTVLQLRRYSHYVDKNNLGALTVFQNKSHLLSKSHEKTKTNELILPTNHLSFTPLYQIVVKKKTKTSSMSHTVALSNTFLHYDEFRLCSIC